MTKIRIFIFICLGMCVSVCECFADNLKVATLVYPPFQYEENGEPKGIAADILREMKKDGSYQKIINAHIDRWGINLD
ncbi:MAG: transporter substrate-binding domain-containing protein [Deltaproteobacteria bacterium]|jgi:ABC-type amino acid transport substrate-binding protein|nr:transporter substrate-binding domain-containing protein [Deltaproteobacteria bacterium]MDL1986360.1 transporter substrate-binding domain-containing protein [Deltaproteobacteria bacterium]